MDGCRAFCSFVISILIDSSSDTATGGKTTVGDGNVFSWRRLVGSHKDWICAEVQDELHMTTSTVPPTQLYNLAKICQ